MKFAGIDSCPGGWAVVLIDAARKPIEFLIEKEFRDVVNNIHGTRLCLIDIPIGLKDVIDKDERRCDIEIRRILSPRGSSVFRVLQRECVYARSYDKACKIAQRGIPPLSWAISKKVAQVDRVMVNDISLQRWIRETHPELCFKILNKNVTLSYSKKTEAGVNERLDIIERYSHRFLSFYKKVRGLYRKKILSDSDIVDAAVCAISACLCDSDGIKTYPKVPEFDSKGLRMEIVVPDIVDGCEFLVYT